MIFWKTCFGIRSGRAHYNFHPRMYAEIAQWRRLFVNTTLNCHFLSFTFLDAYWLQHEVLEGYWWQEAAF